MPIAKGAFISCWSYDNYQFTACEILFSCDFYISRMTGKSTWTKQLTHDVSGCTCCGRKVQTRWVLSSVSAGIKYWRSDVLFTKQNTLKTRFTREKVLKRKQTGWWNVSESEDPIRHKCLNLQICLEHPYSSILRYERKTERYFQSSTKTKKWMGLSVKSEKNSSEGTCLSTCRATATLSQT